MSHFSVLVIGDNVEKQLAPYQENNMGDCPQEFMKWRDANREWHDTKEAAILASGGKDEEVFQENPNAKWDWYVLGGRWGGFFRLKKGAIGILGEPSSFDKIDGDKRDKSKVDQALKKDVDFNAMIQEARDEAAERYEMTLRIFNRHIKEGFRIGWKNWRDFYESYAGQKTATKNNIDFYREIYHAQPVQTALKWLQSNRDRLDLTKKESEHVTWLELDPYNCTKERYVTKAGNAALSTFAILIDGKWYERGQMGWWGAVHDEKDKDQWNAEFKKLLDSVPEETLLTVVDCHI